MGVHFALSDIDMRRCPVPGTAIHEVFNADALRARFRRLARDYERLPTTLAGLHFLAFVILMLNRPFIFSHQVYNTL